MNGWRPTQCQALDGDAMRFFSKSLGDVLTWETSDENISQNKFRRFCTVLESMFHRALSLSASRKYEIDASKLSSSVTHAVQSINAIS
jgi:hypothetical protein